MALFCSLESLAVLASICCFINSFSCLKNDKLTVRGNCGAVFKYALEFHMVGQMTITHYLQQAARP